MDTQLELVRHIMYNVCVGCAFARLELEPHHGGTEANKTLGPIPVVEVQEEWREKRGRSVAHVGMVSLSVSQHSSENSEGSKGDRYRDDSEECPRVLESWCE